MNRPVVDRSDADNCCTIGDDHQFGDAILIKVNSRGETVPVAAAGRKQDKRTGWLDHTRFFFTVPCKQWLIDGP